jgi:hypothetical protein
MRGRQVKPAFWSDSKISELHETTRLFYIGIWMVADDAGWLRWDPAEVARDLYGYEPRARREKRVKEMWNELLAAGRVVQMDCGHAVVPHLTDHQHLAGLTKQVKTFQTEHLRSCATIPANPRGDPQTPAPVRLGKVGLGQVSLGNDAQAREETEAPSLKDKVGWVPR